MSTTVSDDRDATSVFAGLAGDTAPIEAHGDTRAAEARTGYVRQPSSRAHVLVSDEARESAARRLGRAYAKGRIGSGELERRMEGALAARTRADLDAVTHDLPRRRGRRGQRGQGRRGRAVPLWQLPIFPLILLVRAGRARIRRRRQRRLGR
jgi:Domain of unknown function (DUF1707)